MALSSAELAGVVTLYILLFVLFVAFILVWKSCKVVRQAEVMIIERFGKYRKTLKPGLHWIMPFIDNARQIDWRYAEVPRNSTVLIVRRQTFDRIDMREHVIDLGLQRVITRDTVAMDIDALVYYQITDPYQAVIKIQNLPDAIEMLTQSTLRNIVAHMTLDDTFSSRERISTQLKERTLRDAERWGVTIIRVEIMNIRPPSEIKEAMEFQIREERERRSTVAIADGTRESKIIESYGGAAKLVLNAEGQKMSRIQRANGEAEAKLLFSQAEAKAIQLLFDALQDTNVRATDYLVATQYLQTLSHLTNTKAPSKVVLVPRESINHVADIFVR
eukprot:TRINITY_DN7598_c0_g1_i1.p1 TRINITY_DN7598_c0_g1~~TRINITY_DN7598_c0_g1_i1.p1  ORF type:complete len:364 (+),score=54.32 TRINITY_DN7598_c0_g1_i1:98-1093(+)